ncbi:hypothetical protein L596_001073 [Steinernema carpocapsae]|uniref:Uncharacterized protein n=1 Tax=Steinernema carpocapsae TaxID=34508 RepID=A0A4U8UK77_STECR|nr:hypothetical protein L596_001073 [Steinernema carpocapsae]
MVLAAGFTLSQCALQRRSERQAPYTNEGRKGKKSACLHVIKGNHVFSLLISFLQDIQFYYGDEEIEPQGLRLNDSRDIAVGRFGDEYDRCLDFRQRKRTAKDESKPETQREEFRRAKRTIHAGKEAESCLEAVQTTEAEMAQESEKRVAGDRCQTVGGE